MSTYMLQSGDVPALEDSEAALLRNVAICQTTLYPAQYPRRQKFSVQMFRSDGTNTRCKQRTLLYKKKYTPVSHNWYTLVSHKWCMLSFMLQKVYTCISQMYTPVSHNCYRLHVTKSIHLYLTIDIYLYLTNGIHLYLTIGIHLYLTNGVCLVSCYKKYTLVSHKWYTPVSHKWCILSFVLQNYALVSQKWYTHVSHKWCMLSFMLQKSIHLYLTIGIHLISQMVYASLYVTKVPGDCMWKLILNVYDDVAVTCDCFVRCHKNNVIRKVETYPSTGERVGRRLLMWVG